MNSKITILIYFYFVLHSASISIYAQNLERLNTQDLKGGYLGFSSFVDYNNDGYLDIFTTGLDFVNSFNNATFYKNNGDLSFTESGITSIPTIIYGDSSWGDFDNNSTQDLLYSGTLSGETSRGITKVYRNKNNGCEFVELPINLPGISRGTSTWADIDNDGLLDVFLVGFDVTNTLIIKAYKNNGNDDFTEQPLTIAPIGGRQGNLTRNTAKWADLDGDGLQDLIISLASDTDFTFEVYKNLGAFQFSKQDIGLPKLSYVAMDIGDINNDQLLDIVFTGSPNVENTSSDGTGDFFVYTNNGNMNFTNSFIIADEGVFYNDIALGDITNNGYLDVINYGTGPWGTLPEITKIYENNGDGTFSSFTHSLPDNSFGGVEFGDFDNDSDSDILYYGRIEDPFDNEITYIYQNKAVHQELPDKILINQTCNCSGAVDFSLNNSTDNITWNFGDPTSGALNTSSQKRIIHEFSTNANYTVSATYTKQGVTNTLTTEVNIVGLPKIEKPKNINTCFDSEKTSYNFNELLDEEILSGASLNDFEIFYYESLENAEKDIFRITMPFVTENIDKKIYVRIQKTINSNCFVLTDFDISIEKAPIANPVDDLVVCDDDNDGFATFDCSLIGDLVIGNQDELTIEYYDSFGIRIPESALVRYQNTVVNSDTILVQVKNNVTNCISETTVNLIVLPIPLANPLEDLIGCDDNGDGISEFFDTSALISDVLGDQTGMEVDFYTADGAPLLGLQNPYTNTVPDTENITVRVTNTKTNCYAETVVRLYTSAEGDCIEIEDFTLEYPKFFTPNNDGNNDYWFIEDMIQYPGSSILIFNRYGKLLKQLSNTSRGWDGTYNGKKLPTDDYWFRIIIDNEKVLSGHFTLKR